jgi:hypothetical protein
MIDVNFLTILSAVILNQILGILWYSPLIFGRLWLKSANKRIQSQVHQTRSIALQLLSQFFIVFTLALLMPWLGLDTFMKALIFISIFSAMLALVQISDCSLEEIPLNNLIIQIGYRVLTLFSSVIMLSVFG